MYRYSSYFNLQIKHDLFLINIININGIIKLAKVNSKLTPERFALHPAKQDRRKMSGSAGKGKCFLNILPNFFSSIRFDLLAKNSVLSVLCHCAWREKAINLISPIISPDWWWRGWDNWEVPTDRARRKGDERGAREKGWCGSKWHRVVRGKVYIEDLSLQFILSPKFPNLLLTGGWVMLFQGFNYIGSQIL